MVKFWFRYSFVLPSYGPVADIYFCSHISCFVRQHYGNALLYQKYFDIRKLYKSEGVLAYYRIYGTIVFIGAGHTVALSAVGTESVSDDLFSRGVCLPQ